MKTENGDAQNKKPAEHELRRVGHEELIRILEDHKTWVKALHSNEPTGGQSVDLNRMHFGGANLQGIMLYKANLQGADLSDVDLRTADLREADLTGANLLRTKLQGADLSDADLRGAQSLFGAQLAGANISGAKLPDDILKFTGLEYVKEISQNARKIFFGLMLGCTYALLTIATTRIPLLISNSSSSQLPILMTDIPIVYFYWVAPLILIGIFFYFHLYMQRLWDGLAALPAIFPDGEPLYRKAYPWLLVGLVRRHIFRLQKTQPRFSRLQTALSVLLAWWTVPLTIMLLWFMYLPRHDWYGSLLHIALNIVSIGSSISFYHAAAATLRGEENSPNGLEGGFWNVDCIRNVVIVLGASAVFIMFSFGAIEGVRDGTIESADLSAMNIRLCVPRIMATIGYSAFADLTEMDMSIKPENWIGEKREELKFVRGARLRKANLKYVQARQTFFANADLREVDFTGADLTGADLRGANMEGAKLRYADLSDADLTDANLNGADLSESSLQQAKLFEGQFKCSLRGANFHKVSLEEMDFADLDLRGANFLGAQLHKANFRSSELHGAEFVGVNLHGADFSYSTLDEANFKDAHLDQASFEGARIQGTDFRSATGITRKEIVKCYNWILAYYDQAFLAELGLNADHTERIRKKNFRGMDLKNVGFLWPNFENFDLQKANLQGADLHSANLRGANLQDANLLGADLRYADIRSTNFRGAILQECRLGGQDLSEFNFQGMNFRGAWFQEANFSWANFQDADLSKISIANWSNFENANLRGAKLVEADIRNADGLTCEQIASAKIDEKTVLPGDLEECDK